MLNKHYTAVLTLAILVTLGIMPKSIASSDKVKSSSFWEDKLTTLKKDSSINDSNLTLNSEHVYSYINNSQENIFAQNVSAPDSDNGTTTDENQFKLWWLAPLIILVPFVGFWLLKPGSNPKQIEEEPTTSANLTDTAGIASPTPQQENSELAVDSDVSDRLNQEDTNVEEEIDNLPLETATEDLKVSDEETKEQVDHVDSTFSEAIQTASESYEREPNLGEDSQLLENLSSPESLIEPEEIISEPIATSKLDLESPDVDNQKLENSSVEELIVSETISPSPDLLSETEEINAEIASQQTEEITDRELANISEWLHEKIDSNNKDVSDMDDFWDSLSSITEEIGTETIPQDTEEITDRELANISEWLNEEVDPSSNVGDIANNILDNLPDIGEGKEQDSNGELLDNNSLNLEEEQNQNTTGKEGISDSTSNLLEELLNEDSSQEPKT